MDMMAAGVGLIMNLFFVGLIVAAVMKLFQVHTTLTEIKDLLAKAPAPIYAPPASTPQVSAQPVCRQPAPQSITSQATLRMSPEPAAPIVADTRSGEEMLRDLDAQMRIEEASRLKPRL